MLLAVPELCARLASAAFASESDDMKHALINEAQERFKFKHVAAEEAASLFEAQEQDRVQNAMDESQKKILQEQKIDNAAIIFVQSKIKRYLVIGQKADAEADVECLLNPAKASEILGYRVRPGSVQGEAGKYPYRTMPPKIPESKQSKGGYKILTHRDEEFVGLTEYKLIDSRVGTRAFIDLIKEKQFKCIVPQFRINKRELMSPFGNRESFSGRYRFR
jgi:hypothetical protein